LAYHRKKVEIMEAPRSGKFYGKVGCLRLWPSYIGEKGRTLGKTYGIKARCYWESREHVENKGKNENNDPTTKAAA
jgi:hypothetical protein